MDKVKHILNKKNINVIDVSNIFVEPSITRLLDNIKNKLDVVLFVQKNQINKKYIEQHNLDCDVILYYTDIWISYKNELHDDRFEMMINKLIDKTKSFECVLCHTNENSMITCTECNASICVGCLMDPKNNIIHKKNININTNKKEINIQRNCPICKQKSISYSLVDT
jgi:hypothetical protein